MHTALAGQRFLNSVVPRMRDGAEFEFHETLPDHHGSLTRSAPPRLRRKLSRTLRPLGWCVKRRSGSTLSTPQHLYRGVEGLTFFLPLGNRWFNC